MTLVPAPDFVSFSELPLLRSLTSHTQRPNLLILCAGVHPAGVLARLQPMCPQPLHTCLLPGPLVLPPSGAETVILTGIDTLTLEQQVALYDWMSAQKGRAQVVSVATEPLMPLILDGRFLEGLFYRLNTVSVLAARDAVTGKQAQAARS